MQTQSTLKFANRASAIVNNVVHNKHQDLSRLLEMKNDEIRRLRAALQQFGSRPSQEPRALSFQGVDLCKQHKILEQRVMALKVSTCLMR